MSFVSLGSLLWSLTAHRKEVYVERRKHVVCRGILARSFLNSMPHSVRYRRVGGPPMRGRIMMVAVHYGRACCVLCLFICMSAACRPRAKWGDGGQPTMELMRSPLGVYCSQSQDDVADPLTDFVVVIIGAEFFCLLLAYLPMSFFL